MAPSVSTAPQAQAPPVAPAVGPQDVRQLRRYCRLAAALQALASLLLGAGGAWAATLLLDWQWGSPRILVPLALVVVVAAVRYLQAERRLRTYRLHLTADAVTFDFGRRRSYIPIPHIQVFDAESGFLLRRFGLRRCNLHTGGGMIVVSPAPAHSAAAIERLIEARSQAAVADEAHGTA